MFDFIKDNPLMWIIIFLLIVSPSFLFGAFQVVAFIFLVLLLLGAIALLFFRWKITKIAKQAQQQRGETEGTSYRSTDNDRVKIVVPPTEKKVAKDVGDYVDFEEIKGDTTK